MNLFGKLLLITCLGTGFVCADDISLELSSTTETTYSHPVKGLDSGIKCSELIIENTGNKPLYKFLPYVNEPSYLTIENIAEKIAKNSNPLESLYTLFCSRLSVCPTVSKQYDSPLDTLNYVGSCPQSRFAAHFTKLCHAVGMMTRDAGMLNKKGYDFQYLKNEWAFLDIENRHFVLGWDNQKWVSSEEMKDDPLLTMRSYLKKNDLNWPKACESFSRFEIAHQSLADIDETSFYFSSIDLKGFDLFPKEKIVYDNFRCINENEIKIKQTVNIQARKKEGFTHYRSPYPIREIYNDTNQTVYVKNLNQSIRPKSGICPIDPHVLALEFQFYPGAKGEISVTSAAAWNQFPDLKSGENKIYLGSENNETTISFCYHQEDSADPKKFAVDVARNREVFDYESPEFELSTTNIIDTIHWQISQDENFNSVIEPLNIIENFNDTISLPLILETYLSPDRFYYFRVKGALKGQWGMWSEPLRFSVKKPLSVDLVEFNKSSDDRYTLNWEREAEVSDEPIEYLVFGSNAFDFIPSLYYASQVNEMIKGEPTHIEEVNNLIGVTQTPYVDIDGSFAYYRIIARKSGQYSLPSPLIHVYDIDLINPRTVLQMEESGKIAKRVLIPASYPWTSIAYPILRANPKSQIFENGLLHIHQVLNREAFTFNQLDGGYACPKKISEEVWDLVKGYFFPENHPDKPKVDRLFSKARVTQNQETVYRAGFIGRTGRSKRLTAVMHPDCPDLFFKFYCDCEFNLRMHDWQLWIRRIQGKNVVQACIDKYGFNEHFKTPEKWIYPLPEKPACTVSTRYSPKNFILICTNEHLYDHEKNKEYWKSKMTRQIMGELYCLLDECGMWDSCFSFNIPYTKSGKFSWTDTEYYHKWPVDFKRLTNSFASKNQGYWKYLIKNKGPSWYRNKQMPPKEAVEAL